MVNFGFLCRSEDKSIFSHFSHSQRRVRVCIATTSFQKKLHIRFIKTHHAKLLIVEQKNLCFRHQKLQHLYSSLRTDVMRSYGVISSFFCIVLRLVLANRFCKIKENFLSESLNITKCKLEQTINHIKTSRITPLHPRLSPGSSLATITRSVFLSHTSPHFPSVSFQLSPSVRGSVQFAFSFFSISTCCNFLYECETRRHRNFLLWDEQI